MKLLITGDWHLTDKCPKNRSDDYKETVLRKLDFALTTAFKEKCTCILQPGDFTDSPSLSYSFFTSLYPLLGYKLNSFNIDLYTVWGQHDMMYRRKENTLLSALYSSCHRLHVIECPIDLGKDIVLFPCSWGSEIPEPVKGKYNILLIHRMIAQKPIWEGHEDFDQASQFLRKYKFDLIVSGDNHLHFIETRQSRKLINCGSLMRSAINQMEHKPVVYIVDTLNTTEEIKYIPITPPESVFHTEKIDLERERDEKLEAFVSGLTDETSLDFDFVRSLRRFVEDNDIDSGVKTVIDECLKEEE